ncbi:MAG: hypothetical protein DWQ01_14680 [Planctomycetota bacterium]|nr:MAG: hypothetical protein DWQ01_14680 [Planctomycetota bacterium]
MAHLAFLFAAFLAPQSLPDKLPIPSHPVSQRVLEEWREMANEQELEKEKGWDWEAEQFWVAVRPHWLTERTQPLSPAGREMMASSVGLEANGWPENLAEAWLRQTGLEPVPIRFQLEGPDGVMLAGSESLLPGRPVAIRDLYRRAGVLDLNAEIAQQATIADPIMGFRYGGTSLVLELLPVPGRGWQAEIVVVDSRLGEEEVIATGYPALGGLERMPVETRESGWWTLLEPGENHQWALPGGRRLQLSVAAGAHPPAVQDLGPGARYVAVPALSQREDWTQKLAHWSNLGMLWSFDGGYLAFPAAEEELLAEAILKTSAANSQFRQVRLSLRFEGDGISRELLFLDGPMMQGRPWRFAHGDLALALTDWDVEVACTARIADPEIQELFQGVAGQFSLVQGEEGQDPAVAVDLYLHQVALGQPAKLNLSDEQAPFSGHEGESPGMPAIQVLVERPEIREFSIQGLYRPIDGQIAVERYLSGLFGKAGRLLLEIEVR